MKRSSSRRRLGRVVLVAALAAATGLAGVVPADASVRPPIRLRALGDGVTFFNFGDRTVGSLDLVVEADVGRAFRVDLERKSYARPIVARLVRKGKDRVLPSPADFGGLRGFTTTTFADSAGAVVASQTADFCPNSRETTRSSPDAPLTSAFPVDCGLGRFRTGNPYQRGDVWGIEAGWDTSLELDFASYALPLQLAPGTYTETTTITPAYRAALGLTVAQATVSQPVTVETYEGLDCPAQQACGATAKTSPKAQRPPAATTLGETTRGPVGRRVRAQGPLPDLRVLPPWGVGIEYGSYLDFSTTTWNAGPGLLVVDGLRPDTESDRMAAYQYFFTGGGRRKGYTQIKDIVHDTRGNWGLPDWMRLELLDQHRQLVHRGKENAWCPRPTDVVDLTVKRAQWQPPGAPATTASCGVESSRQVRMVLDPGWGTTRKTPAYDWSFDLRGLPNGTYYLRVTVNPERVVHERRTTNNTASRRIVIGGSPDARTVEADPVGLVVEPPFEIDHDS